MVKPDLQSQVLSRQMAHLEGVSAFSGLEYWNGVLEWSTGMEYWTGVLEGMMSTYGTILLQYCLVRVSKQALCSKGYWQH
jgi:hypothetical protein